MFFKQFGERWVVIKRSLVDLMGRLSLRNIRHSIAFKVLLTAFSVYFVITAMTIVAQMMAEYSHAEKRVRTNIEKSLDLVQNDLSKALYDLNPLVLKKIAQKLMNDHFVQGVSIHDVAESYFENKASSNINSRLYLYEVNRLIYKKVQEKDELVGKLRVYYDSSVIFEIVKVTFIYIIIAAMFKTVALWFIFLWVANKYVSDPLGKLTEEIKSIDFEHMRKVAAIQGGKRKNELDHLQKSFNQLMKKLSGSHRQLSSMYSSLKESEQYFDQLINKMPSIIIGIGLGDQVTHWNDQAMQYTGHMEENVLKKNIYDVLPQFKDHIFHLKKRLIAVQSLKEIKRIQIYRDDQKQYFDLMIYPISLVEPGFVIRLDDVSLRIQMSHLEIMVIDSDEKNRKDFVQFLNDYGCNRVISVRSSREAVIQYKDSCALVFMRNEDGENFKMAESLRYLKKIDPKMHLVIMSDIVSEADRIDFRNAGVYNIVQYPFDRGEVTELIERTLL